MGGRDSWPLALEWGRRRFNSRARGRARNSRARGRARLQAFKISPGFKSFNSRARGRARRFVPRTCGWPSQCFNSRARGRARHIGAGVSNAPEEFQLTRPWEGATPYYKRLWRVLKVSTHAPVGGRDPCIGHPIQPMRVFQLTRPWEGATRTLIVRIILHNVVSTHAPVGGRDPPIVARRRTGAAGFNSRARGRARRMGTVPLSGVDAFQLTRPWEGATPISPGGR